MATDSARAALLDEIGTAELTQLGKRIEILRIERGRSKQQLARHARTSRQQLWRVMTGKSELTTGLRDRLAAALGVDVAHLASGHGIAAGPVAFAPSTTMTGTPLFLSGPPVSIGEYLAEPEHLAVTLRTLPVGAAGRRLKRALLNALEDLAVESGRTLPVACSPIHRGVLDGDL